MHKLTTDRFDAQCSIVRLQSNSIDVRTPSHVVEVRNLDESDLLKAVCDYIESRHWSGDCDNIHAELLTAMTRLGDRIRTKKLEQAAQAAG